MHRGYTEFHKDVKTVINNGRMEKWKKYSHIY